jgi:hypothetical protein
MADKEVVDLLDRFLKEHNDLEFKVCKSEAN